MGVPAATSVPTAASVPTATTVPSAAELCRSERGDRDHVIPHIQTWELASRRFPNHKEGYSSKRGRVTPNCQNLNSSKLNWSQPHLGSISHCLQKRNLFV